ncbi:hypothetical protein TIFTF001_050697 [Ficus carica]|uniref:Uncharacterized protein n=1 Tax=Ficus carica TaxID=3494 RepID=A0AA88CTB2_FICCA|nr:hypothetical protein TIFTF001_050697 [Ficus carica]
MSKSSPEPFSVYVTERVEKSYKSSSEEELSKLGGLEILGDSGYPDNPKEIVYLHSQILDLVEENEESYL